MLTEPLQHLQKLTARLTERSDPIEAEILSGIKVSINAIVEECLKSVLISNEELMNTVNELKATKEELMAVKKDLTEAKNEVAILKQTLTESIAEFKKLGRPS